MKLCTLSKDLTENKETRINNLFFTDYLPFANAEQIKVYLYGYFCSENNVDIDLENFAKNLNLNIDEVKDCFEYWQKLNLVQITTIEDFNIIYLPVKSTFVNVKKYEDKYANFNVVAQSMFSHMLSPNEYGAYYELMETKHIESDALLMIMKYCLETKEKEVSCSYILTVANNWISEKITKPSQVEEKLKELEKTSEDILNVLLVLGIKRKASLEELDLYRKWKLDFKFSSSDIIEIARLLKKKGGMKALDNKLCKYYEMQLIRLDDILTYEKNKKHYYSTAKNIVTKLGLYFENLDPVIEMYLNPWLYKGYSDETLLSLADFCFKTENRTLEDMNLIIEKLYKLGLVSLQSIQQYINELKVVDEQIKNILEKLGLSRRVTQRDREQFNIWTNVWNLPYEIIEYGVEISKDKAQPFLYFTKVLNSFHERNITTLDDAKNISKNIAANNFNINKGMFTHSYTEDELNTLFDNLKDIN